MPDGSLYSQVQHHDGITGTETLQVRDMYEEHLTVGMEGVQEVMTSIITDREQISKGKRGPGDSLRSDLIQDGNFLEG